MHFYAGPVHTNPNGFETINNCIAKMEVGCLEYPGASTIGSQPLDWNNAPMNGTTA